MPGTVSPARNFSKDASRMSANRDKGANGIGPSNSSDRYINGPSQMDWQEKYLLIVNEVSMLAARTLYMVNKQLCRLRGSTKDFGGIPIVFFCGDFHQFRPCRRGRSCFPAQPSLPLRRHAARDDLADADEHQDRVPAKTAVAAARRHPKGFTVYASICMHRLQGAREDTEPGGVGAARD
ncbi:hypothetical protein MRS44_013873 [Fusarium solani]|uniref:uncharacterized protein n=1 Tax=Fusarium solani TaxID=169388 RepID=UPI0032C3D953|nr:hypothetical protein MRS44_013873 [Fusarium solani]